MWFGRVWLGLFLCVQANAGYSHHFRWVKPPDREALQKCIADMGRIVEARRAILAGAEGEGDPVITEDSLVFNGRGDRAVKAFAFPGDTGPEKRSPDVPAGFNFCKTGGEPYDEVVTACLIVARDYFPRSVLSLSTDGTWDADWTPGATLYSKVLQRSANNPLNHEAASNNNSAVVLKNLLGLGVAGGIVLLLFKKLRQPAPNSR